MTVTKHVKVVFDGQAYWLLWNWGTYRTPVTLPAAFSYASGPFESEADAEKAVTEKLIAEGWKLVPFRQKA